MPPRTQASQTVPQHAKQPAVKNLACIPVRLHALATPSPHVATRAGRHDQLHPLLPLCLHQHRAGGGPHPCGGRGLQPRARGALHGHKGRRRAAQRQPHHLVGAAGAGARAGVDRGGDHQGPGDHRGSVWAHAGGRAAGWRRGRGEGVEGRERVPWGWRGCCPARGCGERCVPLTAVGGCRVQAAQRAHWPSLAVGTCLASPLIALHPTLCAWHAF